MQAGTRKQSGRCRELTWFDARGAEHPLPCWATWFLEAGAIATAVPPEDGTRRWIVVTVPDRRFAAALLAHSIVSATAQSAVIPGVIERFEGCVPGESYLTWLDSHGQTRFGRYDGIDQGCVRYRRRDRGGWGPMTKRPVDRAADMWPADATAEFVDPQDAATCPEFALAATGCAAENFLARSDIDTIIVGTRSDIEQDLTSATFACGGHQGTLLDTVRPRELVRAGQHHRSAVLASSGSPDATAGSSCHGPAIFDGASAYLRHRDSIDAHTCFVILDRWQPQSEEAASSARIERNETWVDSDALDLPRLPAGIEIYQWVAEL